MYRITVYRNIIFSKKRQQFYAGLPKNMCNYGQELWSKTIIAIIHYTKKAYKIIKPKISPKGDKGKEKENGSLNVKSKDKK